MELNQRNSYFGRQHFEQDIDKLVEKTKNPTFWSNIKNEEQLVYIYFSLS